MSFWQTRSAPASGEPAPPVLPAAHVQTVHGWTDHLAISGEVHSVDRLSDVLNRREPVTIKAPRVQRIGVLGWPMSCGEELEMDPFDFDVVLGGPLDPEAADVRSARRVHKCRYPVIIQGTTFTVEGVLHLFPGVVPEFAAHRTSTLFLPLTQAVARHSATDVTDARCDVVLVNRYSVRTIAQVPGAAAA